jgi:hypothetical protein
MDFCDLMFDAWNCSFVLVSAEVKQRFLGYFGDGNGLFPEEALKERGMDLGELKALRDYLSAISLEERPINRDIEFYRYDDNASVRVAWRKSISSLFDVGILEKINNIIDVSGNDKLRFIVGWG